MDPNDILRAHGLDALIEAIDSPETDVDIGETGDGATGNGAAGPSADFAGAGADNDSAYDSDSEPRSGTQEKKRPERFTLVRFDTVRLLSTAAYLVKGLIPRGGLTIIWGPPKCGKSFWTFDVVMHPARGIPYRGRRVQQGTIVYIALEGGEGFGRRIEAYKQHHDIADAPFYLITDRIDLVRDHKALIAAIKGQTPDDVPSAVVIDTLNRSLTGSESKDEDMAAYIQAADAIREAFSCAVIIVHHCGIDGTRPRGHTSLTGAADAQIAVARDAADNIIATVEWMKDGADGDVVASRLETVDLGRDEDGEPIVSCVIIPAEGEQAKPSGRKINGAKKVALDLLRNAIDEAGATPPASNHIPQNTRTISIETWRSYAYQGTITESDNPDSRRKAFVRAVKNLQAAGLIGIWNNNVWIT